MSWWGKLGTRKVWQSGLGEAYYVGVVWVMVRSGSHGEFRYGELSFCPVLRVKFWSGEVRQERSVSVVSVSVWIGKSR